MNKAFNSINIFLKNKLPSSAIIAVTLNCNARCIMCNIWKNKIKDELKPYEYLKLPGTLKEINITGGEPFIRNDLINIIENIKKICRKARIVISSNGYLTDMIELMMRDIIKIDRTIALRISIDGNEKTHNTIRGLKNSYTKALDSIEKAKSVGVKDLGISMTISNINVDQIYNVFELSKQIGVEMTIGSVFESEIYFGRIDEYLGSFNIIELEKQLFLVAKERTKTLKIKEWARAWFEAELLNYIKNRQRPLNCNAGNSFFYMDSLGKIYGCHMIDNYIGDLRSVDNFFSLWNDEKRRSISLNSMKCNKCWMVCTSQPGLNKEKYKIILKIINYLVKNKILN